MHPFRTLARLVPALLALLLTPARAPAQCNPAIYEIGGKPGVVCPASINYQAVGRGRFVSIESTPITGAPSVVGRVGLDAPAVHMHTEFLGRIWATDGVTLYGIDTGNPSSPQVLGRYSLPISGADRFTRVRIKGSFVYAVSAYHLYIFDVSNPAAPALRSTFQPATAYPADVEVVGSYAYLSVSDYSATHASLMVVDVGNPQLPVEVRRLGNADRDGYRITSRGGLLYTLARNDAAGAIEAWSLTNASNPALLSVNATISAGNMAPWDELRAASSAVVYMQIDTNLLRFYNTSTLSQVGPTSSFTDTVEGMGLDYPNVYITRSTGQVDRVNISTPTAPVITRGYIDVAPGTTSRVATLNEGFSALTGDNSLWVFRTPSGVQPTLLAHLGADQGYSWQQEHLVILTGGTLLAVETTYGPTPTSWIIAYNVVPSSGVSFVGAYQVAGLIQGIDAGTDSTNTRRIYYTVGTYPNYTLRVLNANNLGSMTQDSAFALSTGVSTPVRFLPGSTLFGTPPRVLIGATDRVQIVSVASPAFPSTLGTIPSGARAITAGAHPNVWIGDHNLLKCYSISTPSAPALQSSTRIGIWYDYPTDIKMLSPFANVVGVTTGYGDLVELDASNPANPFIFQIARLSVGPFWGSVGGLAWDGTNIHFAHGADGYTVTPVSISAPPRENPNFALDLGFPHGIAGVCGGTPLTLTAHFVASPAVSSYQWMKYNSTANAYQPLANGPTGSGSTVSGATTATLTINSPGAGDVGFYECQATNSCGSGTTAAVEARMGGYANCDASLVQPVLNVADFTCFLQRFAAGAGYANCDDSTAPPTLNVADFTCFLQRFAAGCQ